MRTETQLPPPPPWPDFEFRIELAKAITKMVGFVAADRGLDREGELAIRSAMIHKLIHRNFQAPAEAIQTYPILSRLERMAERLVDRELRRRAKNRATQYGLEPLPVEDSRSVIRRIHVGTAVTHLVTYYKTWSALTPPERQVVRLEELHLDPLTCSRILETSIEEVETIRRQAKAKIHEAYLALF